MYGCLCSLVAWQPYHGIWNLSLCSCMYQASNGRTKKKKNHAFSFLNLSVHFCFLRSEKFSLRAVWTNTHHILIPKTTSRLSGPFDSKSPKSRRWIGTVESVLSKDDIWSVLKTSQLLLLRELKAVRKEEFHFNSIICSLYWHITFLCRGLVILYFMSWR